MLFLKIICIKNPSRQNVIDLNVIDLIGDKLCGSVSMTYFCLLKSVVLIIPNEFLTLDWSRCGHDHIVVGFTATCAISAYHN